MRTANQGVIRISSKTRSDCAFYLSRRGSEAAVLASSSCKSQHSAGAATSIDSRIQVLCPMERAVSVPVTTISSFGGRIPRRTQGREVRLDISAGDTVMRIGKDYGKGSITATSVRGGY